MRAEDGVLGLDGVLLYGWFDLDFICHFVDATLVLGCSVDGCWRTSFWNVVRLDGQRSIVVYRFGTLRCSYLRIFFSIKWQVRGGSPGS